MYCIMKIVHIAIRQVTQGVKGEAASAINFHE